MNFRPSLLGTAAVAIATLAPTNANAATLFKADIVPLNQAFGSTASGSAQITLDQPSETLRTLRVQIDVSGLQDLSSFGGIHVAHIHGQFSGNASRPLFDQGNGPFFTGAGGGAVESVLPTLADDIDGDGFLNFIEGRPAYGPVVLNLTRDQLPAPPSGVPPLSQFLELASTGTIDPAALFPAGTTFSLDTTYQFDLTDADQARQFNNLTNLDQREIVIHGLTVPASISDPIDDLVTANGSGAPLGIPVGDGQVFRITAPVAAGNLQVVEDEATSVPEPLAMSLIGGVVLALGLKTTQRHTG